MSAARFRTHADGRCPDWSDSLTDVVGHAWGDNWHRCAVVDVDTERGRARPHDVHVCSCGSVFALPDDDD